MPLRFEFAFEVEIVFYDTVVDYGDSGFAVDQRVRVFLDRSAVCCPAGVSDADGSRQEVKVVLGVDLVKSSAVLLYGEGSVCNGYLADGVVSAIF